MTEPWPAIGVTTGQAPSRFADEQTAFLNVIAKGFEDLQKTRIAAGLRGDEFLAEGLHDLEIKASRRLGRAMQSHVMWPFLSELKGLSGPRVGRLLAIIGDPLRFPGQKCSMGHTLRPVFQVGQRCPVTADLRSESGTTTGGDNLSPDGFGIENENRDDGGTFPDAELPNETGSNVGIRPLSPDGSGFESETSPVGGSFPGVDRYVATEPASGTRIHCVGSMLPPRTGTGVASLWHYFGLHVVDGKLPMRRKGQQADWHITARALILGPQGVSTQIVMQRTPKYRDIYDQTKGRLADRSPELPPFRVNNTAKIVAAKAFLGDLLVEWKRIVGEADGSAVTEQVFGLSDNFREAG